MGYWACKRGGKTLYFGPRYGTYEEAVSDYKMRMGAEVGRDNRPPAGTLGRFLEWWVTYEQERMHKGEITKGTFSHITFSAAAIDEAAGQCLLASVNDKWVADFLIPRLSAGAGGAVKQFSPKTVSHCVKWLKSAVNKARREGIDLAPLTHSGPRAIDIRRSHQANPRNRIFHPEQVRFAMKAFADHPYMLTAILLGINCGMGQTDIAGLRAEHIREDGETTWLEYPRWKTAMPRWGVLWPETVAALKNSIAMRPKPLDSLDEPLLLTRLGNPLLHWTDADEPNKSAAIDQAWRKMRTKQKREDIPSFRRLRSTFATIAKTHASNIAYLDACMGHTQNAVRSVYFGGEELRELLRIARGVHAWLYSCEATDEHHLLKRGSGSVPDWLSGGD